jgi:hypothetical protein
MTRPRKPRKPETVWRDLRKMRGHMPSIATYYRLCDLLSELRRSLKQTKEGR